MLGSLSSHAHYVLLLALSVAAEVVSVDPDWLEYNQAPFVACRTWGLTYSTNPNKTYEGFILKMDVDIRGVLGTPETDEMPAIPPFPFSHKIYRTKQTVVTAPMLPF